MKPSHPRTNCLKAFAPAPGREMARFFLMRSLLLGEEAVAVAGREAAVAVVGVAAAGAGPNFGADETLDESIGC